MIEERKSKGIDRYDEVWDGTYVIPATPTNAQQLLVDDLGDILTEVVKAKRRGTSSRERTSATAARAGTTTFASRTWLWS